MRKFGIFHSKDVKNLLSKHNEFMIQTIMILKKQTFLIYLPQKPIQVSLIEFMKQKRDNQKHSCFLTSGLHPPDFSEHLCTNLRASLQQRLMKTNSSTNCTILQVYIKQIEIFKSCLYTKLFSACCFLYVYFILRNSFNHHNCHIIT